MKAETEEQRFLEIYAQEAQIPTELEGKIRIRSCLAWREEQQVYLAQDEKGKAVILKTAQGTQTAILEKEAENLKNSAFSFVPALLQYGASEGSAWLLRAYIPGVTLWERIEGAGALEGKEAKEVMRRLCSMTAQLHKNVPPLIHRDLKPQNIILTEEDNLFLIDMGTVREYREDAAHDTVFVGTRVTAAPEQYGYRQTDCRTDVYALGVIFLYLLTGSMDVQKYRILKQAPEEYRDIIEKCTRLDPGERYQNCEELKEALACAGSEKTVQKKKRHRKRRIAAAAIPGVLAICLGAGICGAMGQNSPYHFRSELIEQAVREQLGKTEGQVIYKEELAEIESLRICGSRILGEDDTHYYYCGTHTINNEESANETMGSIRDISDLAYMSSLHTLILDRQQITDISPLASLPLTELSLCDNPLEDLSALESVHTLTSVALGGTETADLTPLQGAKELAFLDITNSEARKIAPIAGLPIKNLQMNMVEEEDYEVLKQLPLTKLVLHSWSSDLENIIGELDADLLKELTVYGYQHNSLEPLAGLTGLTALDLYDSNLNSLEGIENFPKLRSLVMGRAAVTDISPLVSLTELQNVWLENSAVMDFSPLQDMKALVNIGCDEVQLEEINKIIENPWFETRVYERDPLT